MPRSQGPGTLSGVVVDSLGRPVPEATVYIVDPRRTALSRANGTFRFDSLAEGTYSIGARAIGFISTGIGRVTMGPAGIAMIIEMTRVPTELPTMTTSARRGGLSGVIGDTSYQAMSGVTVRALGSGSGAVKTDSMGEFFIPIKPGRYMIRLERPGYRRQLVSVTVPADSGRRIAAWLAPMQGKENPIVGKNMFELEQRLMRMTPVKSRLYTHEDFTKLGIKDAHQAAERFTGRRLQDDECAKIDGGPAEAPLWTIPAEDIELMETYYTPPPRGQVAFKPCVHIVWLRK